MSEAKELNQTMLAILASVDEGIHVVNRQGVTVSYNAAAARLDGLEPEEVIGRPLLEIFPSLTGETSTLLRVVRTGKPILNQQQTFTNFKGRRITTVNSTVPVFVDGELVGAVEVSRDVTREKELSERIVDLQAELYARRRHPPSAAEGGARFQFSDFLGNNKKVLELKALALRAARSSSSVLVYGETGTGKEIIVQAIHNASSRRRGPFIAQNCAAIPESLLEGIIFGTTRGGFTGAEDRPGLFELADGGSLFLDEINSMDLDLQAKLLRVLQEGYVRRLGDSKLRRVDVRVMAATSSDPWEAVRRKQLRSDLYYRINVVSLRVPPLRERRDDIPLLTQHFLAKYNEKLGLSVRDVSRDTLEMFMRYDWPGNVRELEHAIEGAMNILEGEIIEPWHLPPHWREFASSRTGAGQDGEVAPLKEALGSLERQLVSRALALTDGNISKAARLLRVPRQTLQYRLRSLGLP